MQGRMVRDSRPCALLRMLVWLESIVDGHIVGEVQFKHFEWPAQERKSLDECIFVFLMSFLGIVATSESRDPSKGLLLEVTS